MESDLNLRGNQFQTAGMSDCSAFLLVILCGRPISGPHTLAIQILPID